MWENNSGEYCTGYLSCLLSIIDVNASGALSNNIGVDENVRLMAAILLKNATPKVFSTPIPTPQDTTANGNDNAHIEMDTVNNQNMHQERAHVRSQLPLLLFREPNDKLALYLQLGLSSIALFDFPKVWPSILEDLVGVASGTSGLSSMSDTTRGGGSGNSSDSGLSAMQVMRVRAIKTLRMCLQSIRNRKVVIQKGGGKGGRQGLQLLDMRNLRGMIGKAVQDRKEVQTRACSIFESLAEGIVRHAQVAVGGTMVEGGAKVAYSTWKADSMLAVGYTKCMMELIPMMEIDDIRTDPRCPPVRALYESLAQILQAVKIYPAVPPPSFVQVMNQPAQTAEYAMRMDKLYRATLMCCGFSVQSQSQLFAPQIAYVLPSVVEPILTSDEATLQSMPVKRLTSMTWFIQTVLKTTLYDEKLKNSLSSKNAVLAALMGGGGSVSKNDNDDGPNNDPGVLSARETVTAMMAEGTIERLIESLVGKFLRLHPDELEEWENDPEGRYETDMAERSPMEFDSPRHCGGILLVMLLSRETDRVVKALLDLTQRVYQQLPPDDFNGMVSREACYRALELCRMGLVGGGRRNLNFEEWFKAELLPIIQTELAETSPVAMRAMQARAVQVVQAYAASLKKEDFGIAFQAVAKLLASPDVVVSLCAARCVFHLALMHIKGTEEVPQLVAVREYSVMALGNTFALANRVEGEECLRVTLECISGLVEANGIRLEPILQAIAEQLPPLWERARDSVPIHSCLLSVLRHLIMKMGHSTVENVHVQTVLFPLLDYCTDISVENRAETLLEDGLTLWLVTLVSSRVSTMGQALTNMLPRLESIIRAKLEPQMSLKVLQYSALLLGQRVVEPLADTLRELLVEMTSCVHAEKKQGDDDNEMKDEGGQSTKEKVISSNKDAVSAFCFADALMQMFPELGYSVSSSAITQVIASLKPERSISPSVLELALSAFGRLLWINNNILDEVFAHDPEQDEKIAAIVSTWLGVCSSFTFNSLVLGSKQERAMMFIEQKGAALATCSAVCRSPRVARVAGKEVVRFTRILVEAESQSNLDLNALIETSCCLARRVVGDGLPGDSCARTREVMSADPLVTTPLQNALESAEQATKNASA